MKAGKSHDIKHAQTAHQVLISLFRESLGSMSCPANSIVTCVNKSKCGMQRQADVAYGGVGSDCKRFATEGSMTEAARDSIGLLAM